MANVTDIGLFLLRVAAGAIFLYHGIPKIKNFKGTYKWIRSEGFPLPLLSTLAMIGAETIGGVLLILGLFFPWAPLVLAVNMFVATMFHFKKGEGWKGAEEAAMLCVVAIALAIAGAGAWTILG